jgi:uncharacterized protein
MLESAEFPLLLPEGAALLPTSRTLVVADVHLGKSATFRARGLPVPEGDNARDLARLSALIDRHDAARLVVAGDLFHSPAGLCPELEDALATFIGKHPIPLQLVLGNHDTRLPYYPAGLDVVHECIHEGVRVIHDPADAQPGWLNLAGHLHPVVRITVARRQSPLRLPCFLWRGNTLVMPAFGSFTGGALIKPAVGDRIFVAHQATVIELPQTLLH